MALPGIFIGMAFFGWDIRQHPESVLFGAPLGLMLSGYVALVFGYLHGWSAAPISIALLVLAALTAICATLRRKSPALLSLRAWNSVDYSILGGMGLTTLGFITIPFLRVGELTSFGHAYTWLFGFDFILRAAYAASITLGLPIDHIHMAGVPLQMYLVGYILPAFSYSLCGEAANLRAILLVTEILFDLVFIGTLIAFWRLFAKSRKALLATAFVALLAYSYYGWFDIAHYFEYLLPASIASRLQTQFEFGSVSHLYQRLFMVEPQAVLALSVFLFVITVLLSSERRQGFAVTCLTGIAIGVEFGIDSWLGMTLAITFSGVQLMRLWKHWSDYRIWLQSLLAGAIAIALWTTFFLIHMVGLSSGSLVTIHPYWFGLKFGIFQYAIEYGPMLPLGLVGLTLLWRRSRLQTLSLALIATFAVSQDLFVTIADLPHFRTGNRLLPLVLLAGTAFLFEHAKPSRIGKWLIVGAVALAVPTFFTDIVGASNIGDRQETAYVSDPDLKACEWIRTHLPQSVIIQSKPDYVGDELMSPSESGRKEVSLIPTFAFRRSALGAEYAARSMCAGCKKITDVREKDFDTMFKSLDPKVIATIASKYKIGYLYIGPVEEKDYPTSLGVMETSSLFDEVYNADSVHIFQVKGTQP